MKPLALLLTLAFSAHAETIPSNGKLKFFIMSGQSNMVGFGQLKGSPGTMETYFLISDSMGKEMGRLITTRP